MTSAIEVRGLTKRYGTTAAVQRLTFGVRPGRVTGFVGPNGAGKSTTMRLILNLDAADEGDALINGRRYRDLATPLREVGALLDEAAVHPGRRAADHLRWLARSNDLSPSRIDGVLDLVGLTAAAGRRVGGFSLGMRQRLGIAAALLGDPGVLLLDEPVNGLDPQGIRWIRGLLRSLADEGRTILVSSHLMGELEDTADDLVVVAGGWVVAETTVLDLLGAAPGDRVALRTPRVAELTTVLAAAGARVETADGRLVHATGIDAARIGDLAADHGIPLHELTPQRRTLEEAFVELTGNGPSRDASTAGAGR